MTGLLRMRKRVCPTPLKKCVQVFDKEDRVHIHRLRRTCPLSSFRVWHNSCPNTYSGCLQPLKKCRTIGWRFFISFDDQMTTWKFERTKRRKRPSPFLGMKALYAWMSGANSPVMRGLYCDSRDFLVLTLSHFVDLTRIPLTSITNHIFSLRWTTMLGEVRIWRWQNFKSF
jgi:hypothetical protein